MKNILIYGDYLAPSGFSTVTEKLVEKLQNDGKYKVDICATNFGDRDKILVSENITAYNAKLFAKNYKDKWYRDGFLKLLQSKPYELVWIINDFPVILPLNDLIKQVRENKSKLPFKTDNLIKHPPFKIVLYAPIDSKPPKKWFEKKSQFDKIVTYTKYAHETIKPFFKKSENIEIIPHGIGGEEFYAVSEKEKIALRKDCNIHVDYLIGTVNKNHARKDIGSTLIIFNEYKKRTNKKVGLYLHTYHSDPTGIKIHDAAERLGLVFNKDYFLPDEKKYAGALYTRNDMAKVYQMFDCFLTTSMAEGWGLTLTEAIATKLPIVFGNHTSQEEIMKNVNRESAFGKIDILHPHIQIFDGEGVRFKLDVNQTVEKLLQSEWVSQDDLDYSSVNKAYDWKKIQNQWAQLFDKLLK